MLHFYYIYEDGDAFAEPPIVVYANKAYTRIEFRTIVKETVEKLFPNAVKHVPLSHYKKRVAEYLCDMKGFNIVGETAAAYLNHLDPEDD